MPITVAPTSARARTKCRWVGGKAGSTKTTFTASRVASVGGRRRLRRAVPDAGDRPVRRHGGAAARRPPRGGHDRPRGAGAARARPASRRALARGRRAGPAADRGRRPGSVGAARAGSSGWSGPWSSCRCPSPRSGRPSASPGIDVDTARNVRDKSRMKTVLHAAGIPCARHRLVTGADDAFAFAEAVGFPLVAKPPAGAGAQATYRLDDAGALRSWVAAVPPRPEAPGLLEEFLVGEEHTFDSVQVGGVHGVGVGVGLPAPTAGRAAQPVDPVDGAAAARARRPALRRDPRTSGRPPSGRSGCATG